MGIDIIFAIGFVMLFGGLIRMAAGPKNDTIGKPVAIAGLLLVIFSIITIFI